MKKALLLSALLVPAYALSAIKMEFKANCHGNETSKEFILSDDSNEFSFGYEHENGCAVKALVNFNEDEINYDVSIIEKQEDGSQEVVSQPQIKAQWGKQAILELGETSAEGETSSISIAVTATRVQDEAAEQE